MKKILLLLASVVISASVHAQTDIISTFTQSSTGTTSATAVIPAGQGNGKITDMSYKLDSGATTGTIAVYPGKAQISITSATTGSGSVIWFDNSAAIVAAGDYLIYTKSSTGNSTLIRAATTAITTSATIQETLAAIAVTDTLVTTRGRFVRHAPQMTASSMMPAVNIWLPSNLPSAVAIDGNTTACSVFVNGTRSKD